MANTGDGNFPNQGGWLKGRGRGRGRGISALIKTNNGYLIWRDWFFEASGGGATVLPLTGVVTLTGFAPTIQTPRNVNADIGLIILTGFAPTVSVTDNKIVLSGLGEVILTGYSPTVSNGSVAAYLKYWDGATWQLVTSVNLGI